MGTSTVERPDKIGFQYIVALSCTLFMLCIGVSFGWNSPTIPRLRQTDSPIPITADESSWIVSLMKIGTIISPIPSAWMMDKYGRKTTLLLGAIPLVCSWLLIATANSVELIYISRILSGLSYGLGYAITPMYLSEISSDRIRGSISTILSVMVKVGLTLSYSVGPYVSIRLMAWLALVPLILYVMTFSFLPESPYYYLGKNRNEEAFNSLARLRGTRQIQREFRRMEEAVRKSQENKGTYRELFFTNGNRRGLLIILGLGAVQQLSGSQAIIAYSQIIFEKVGGGLGASEGTIIFGVVQVLTAIAASVLIDVLGRRPLLLISVIGAAVCNGIVGIYFLLVRKDVDVTSVAYIPMIAIMVYIFSYGIGMGTATFAVLGEIFPKNLKAIAAATYMINTSIFQFIVTKLFQVVSDGLGSEYTFFGFAIFSFIFIPFVLWLVPETKGKSLDCILEEMNSSKRNKCKLIEMS